MVMIRHNKQMITNTLLDFEGAVHALTVERAAFVRHFPGWKEAQRVLVGRYSWNSEGLMSSAEEDGELRVYAYDESGNQAACYRLDARGKELGREIWERNAGSLPVRRIVKTTNPLSEEIWVYEHSDNGRICAEKKGKHVRVEKRNAEGLLEQEYLYDGEKPDLVTDYTYNNAGRPLSVTVRDVSGKVHRQSLMEWDNDGRLKAETRRDGSGRLLLDEVYAYGASHGKNWLERVTWVRTGLRSGKRHPSEVYYRSFTLAASESGSAVNGAVNSSDETLAFANGLYQGAVVNGKPEGAGVFIYNNESRYEGEFRNGVLHGKGTLTWSDGRRMEGVFKEGTLEGRGSCSWSDGSRYTGEFREGLMHGPGEFVWADGTRFTGLFEQGRRTEQGVWEKPQ